MFKKKLSKRIKLNKIKTVCLTLGPYRNLTTLTASLLSLHPNCQVLNHAGQRILKDESLYFFVDCSEKKYVNFMKYAIYTSKSGEKGSHGGSITFSHAYSKSKFPDVYKERFGKSLVKSDIQCLFWKESLVVENVLRQNNVSFDELFELNPQLKFLSPVRNPLDCAKSNLRTGLYKYFPGISVQPDIKDVLNCVLDELLWFVNCREKYSNRFFYFYEHDFTERVLLDLVHFLHLEANPQWIDDVLSNYTIKKSYAHDTDLVEYYSKIIREKFVRYPAVVDQLAKFSPKSPPELE